MSPHCYCCCLAVLEQNDIHLWYKCCPLYRYCGHYHCKYQCWSTITVMRNHRKTQERHLHPIKALRMMGTFLVWIGEFCVKAFTSTGRDKVLWMMERVSMVSWKHNLIPRDLNCFFDSDSVKVQLSQIFQWIQDLLNYRAVWNLCELSW